jgi:ubiquitin-protein ligase
MTDSNLSINRGRQLMYVLKEVMALQKNEELAKTTEFTINESDLSQYRLKITPDTGLYQGVPIKFTLKVPSNYPATGYPIQPTCLTDIYHPNLHSGGRVCLHLDGIGSFETGYKETLDGLVNGLHYLFQHPGNRSVEDMSERERVTIEKNIEQFKIREKLRKEKNQNITIREFYSDDLNPSLVKIANIGKYFPQICMSRDSLERYVVFTLGGKKEMSLAKIETIISQLMRDPRYEYVTVQAPKVAEVKLRQKGILSPDHPRQVKMTRISRIVVPTEINMSFHRIRTSESTYQIGELYDSGVSIYDAVYKLLDSIDTKEMKVISNITIESNYDMVMGMSYEDERFKYKHDGDVYEDDQNKIVIFRPLQSGKNIQIDILPIMPYQEPSINQMTKPRLFIGNEFEKTPHILPCFRIECSVLVYGKSAYRNFVKSCFKIDPTNSESPYVKLRRLKQYIGDNDAHMFRSTRHAQYICHDQRRLAVTDFRELTSEELSFLNGDEVTTSILENRDRAVLERVESTEPSTFEDRKVGDVTVMSESEIDQIFKMIGAFDNDRIREFVTDNQTPRKSRDDNQTPRILGDDNQTPRILGNDNQTPRKSGAATKSATKSVNKSARTKSPDKTKKDTFADVMTRYIASNVDETGLDIAGIRTLHDASIRRY